MRRSALLLPLLAALTLQLAATPDQIRDFWFSGAEINRYALEQARYGDTHPGHAELIFVTEPFLTDQQVKADDPRAPDAVDVLKLNALRTFNTGLYSYRTMTSTFRPVDWEAFPHALKSTTSVQDWCGQVFQQINRRDDGWRFELRSYFQSEGDQNRTLPDVWLEDELWVLLRLAPDRLPVDRFRAIPGALFTRFAHQPVEAMRAEGELDVGPETSRYAITYPALARTLTIRFDTAFPHIIRGWTDKRPGGTTRATLEDRIMNSNYWRHNAPGDRAKRKRLGLEPVPE